MFELDPSVVAGLKNVHLTSDIRDNGIFGNEDGTSDVYVGDVFVGTYPENEARIYLDLAFAIASDALDEWRRP